MVAQLTADSKDLVLTLTIPKAFSPYLTQVYTSCKIWEETIEDFVLREMKEKTFENYSKETIDALQIQNGLNIQTTNADIETIKQSM